MYAFARSLRVSVCGFACMSICAVPAQLCINICEAVRHFETCEGEARCVCVTRRLVATGGGKQADLYSVDHPAGRRWGGGVNEGFRSRREMEGRNEVYSQDKNCALGMSVCMLTDNSICAHLSSHPLPQPAVQCPVCQRC